MDLIQFLGELAPIQYGWWCESKKKAITWKDPEFEEEGFFEKNCRVLKPDEVRRYKYGTCWDLTLLIFEALSKQQSTCSDVTAFYFEIADKRGEMISTHSSVLFRNTRTGKYFWFEYSWYQHKGIHGPFDSPEQFFKLLQKNFFDPKKEMFSFLNKSFDAAALLKLDVITAEKFVEIARTQMK